MIVLTTDISKFKSECPNIYVLNSQVKSADIQHEMMLNEKFKENLCNELLRRYGIFACSDRWLITDELLKSHLSCIVDFGNSEEYNIQDYKSYFGRVPALRDKVFNTCKDFCSYIQSNQVDVNSSYTMKDFGVINLLKILRDTGGFIMSNIEESIRIAMKELGIDIDEPAEAKSDFSDDSEDVAEEVVESESTLENDEPEIEPEEDSKPVVYVKIKGDSVALIFDSDVKFQSKELGGQCMNVLSFKMPDMNSEKLQELELIMEEESESEPVKETKTEVVKKPVKRTPIVTNTVNDAEKDSSDEITELKNQKAAIDLKIKEARSKGDTELVNSLRKQRRAIRNKINSIGG